MSEVALLQIGSVADMVTERIGTKSLNATNYVSTENMLPNCGGIIASANIPDQRVTSFKEEDTLFSNIRTYFRKVWFADRKGGASPDVIVFRSKDTNICDSKFLYYLISSERFIDYTVVTAKGTKMPRGDKEAMNLFEFPKIDIDEQRKIAHILGTLDDKIELNRKMNATLEAMARALFQSWFVDFDPVCAKQEGRTPDGLDEATAALFPDSFEDSELGPIPKGWRVSRIDEVAKINDWTLSKNDALETLEYVEISEVNAGNVGNTTTYNRGEEPSRARRRLRHGDTVLSTVRPDRRSYFISLNPPENRIVSTGFAVVTPTKVPWSFVHSTLTRDEVFERLGHLADGAAYPAVRPEVITALKVAVPTDPSLLNAFHIVCGSLFMRAESNREQSRTLATLRDTLLPKLLSGELSTSRMKRRHFYEAD